MRNINHIFLISVILVSIILSSLDVWSSIYWMDGPIPEGMDSRQVLLRYEVAPVVFFLLFPIWLPRICAFAFLARYFNLDLFISGIHSTIGCLIINFICDMLICF